MIIAVIPARYASTRLPGKMLLDLGGKPLLWHTWSRACCAQRLDRLIIAAGDEQIAKAAENFIWERRLQSAFLFNEHLSSCAEVVEVFDDLPSGSDRVWKVANRLQIANCKLQIGKSEIRNPKSEIIVNIQGDEPQLDPAIIDMVVDRLLSDPEAGAATAASPLKSEQDYLSPSCVKVVLDSQERALYFSRSPVPHCSNLQSAICNLQLFRHIGIYAYRWEILEQFVGLPPSPLEKLEKLEQLRLMEVGVKFAVAVVDYEGVAVDTEEDWGRVRQLFKGGEI